MAAFWSLYLSYFIVLFYKGEAAGIQTKPSVLAAVGQRAALACQLSGREDVIQITWQKVLPDGKKNLATYTKQFGSKVGSDLGQKLTFQYEDLQSCSVLISEVTEQDEGCYKCLFNTYSRGAVTGTTCLRVYELHDPVLQVRAAESLVSCSATGRPAPTVTLTAPQASFSHYNTLSVTNTNGTVTVTSTAVLSAPSHSSTQLECSVRLLSAHKQLLLSVPGSENSSDEGVETTSGSDVLDQMLSRDDLKELNGSEKETLWRSFIFKMFAGALFLLVFVGFGIIAYYRKLKDKDRDPESIKTPQKPDDPSKFTTPLMKKEKEHLKKRSTGKKSPESSRSSLFSPSAAKRLFE